MTEQQFITALKEMGITLSLQQITQLENYYKLLVEWNKKINLTAIIEKPDVYLKHFYDSITLTKIINLNNEQTLCDVGTGAGFPGIVLKIIFPHLKVTLIDSLNKRITFLNAVIDQLGLEGIVASHYRIEEYGLKSREMFDVVTARAVAPLNVLLEYCIPIVKINKHFIGMKSKVKGEVENSKSALQKLNCEITEQKEFNLPFEDSLRTLVKIRKNGETNKKYPRRYDKIKKQPL